jgi:hypothetical protein
MELETWTKNILESNKRKKAVLPSEKLLIKLYNIPNEYHKTESLKFKSVFYLVASVIIVLGFNLFSWISLTHSSESNGLSEVMYYFNYLNTAL